MKYLLLALILAVPFHSCSTGKFMYENQRVDGHFRLYSYPAKLVQEKINSDRYTKIAIAASNDFEGNINPTQYPIKNRFNENRVLKVGGIAATKAYLDIFRKEFKDNFIYVDAGSFLHPKENHQFTIFLYNYLGTDAASLGLNEFLLNKGSRSNYPNFLKRLTKKSRFKILNSNVTYLLSDEQIQQKGIQSSYIKKINGIKVGFIGALTQDISQDIPDQNIHGLHIENPAKNIILNANSMRRKGAQVIILMVNSGINCTSIESQEEGIIEEKVNFYPENSKFCDTHENKFYQLLKELPPHTVDVVFTSGTKSKVANNILGYPVLQSPGQGKYLSWLELYFDKKHNQIDRARTRIRQPVQLCHSFLKESQDCFTLEGIDNEELMPAVFLGRKVLVEPLPRFK